MIGEHPGFRAGAVIYGANLTASTAALYLNWHYAWKHGHVLVKDSDLVVTRRFQRRTLRVTIAYSLATSVSWSSPTMGFYLYIAIVLVFAFRQVRSQAVGRLLGHT